MEQDDASRAKAFGNRLRELRKKKEWSLRKAAKDIDVSHMRLGELEEGQSRGTGHPTKPTRELVGRIAKAYGVPKDHLLELAGYSRERPVMSDHDSLLLDLFHTLDERHQEMAIKILEAMNGV